MRDINVSIAAVASTLLVVAACGEPVEKKPTYHADIAPLVARSCLGCHHPGGIAPFPLTSFDEVRQNAGRVAAATQSRRMPPWNQDNSGACQTFTNARWLSDAEIETIRRWVAAGTPEGVQGDAGIGPQSPTPEGPELATPVVRAMAAPYTPSGSPGQPNDDYRCFVVDGFDADTFVTAFEVRPGQPSQVHHIIGYAALTDGAEGRLRALDARDDGPGWRCFGGLLDDEVIGVFGWAPGPTRIRYPDGIGIEVPGRRTLVWEVHYNLSNGTAADQTSVAFETAARVERVGLLLDLDDQMLNLPPGQREATHVGQFSFGSLGVSEPLVAYGLGPHMHLLGRRQRVERVAVDGVSTCMSQVNDWDFHWQDVGYYSTPLTILPTDILRVTCTYDTTGRPGPIQWGEGTNDEMCLIGLLLTRENGRSFSELWP